MTTSLGEPLLVLEREVSQTVPRPESPWRSTLRGYGAGLNAGTITVEKTIADFEGRRARHRALPQSGHTDLWIIEEAIASLGGQVDRCGCSECKLSRLIGGCRCKSCMEKASKLQP